MWVDNMNYIDLFNSKNKDKLFKVLDLQTGQWVALPLNVSPFDTNTITNLISVRPATVPELRRFHIYWSGLDMDRYEFIEQEKE